MIDGHPHDTQKLSYFRWALAETHGIPATADTVDYAFATAIATHTARYTELWDGLTTNQRNLNAFDVGEDTAALIGGTLLNLAARAISAQALLPRLLASR